MWVYEHIYMAIDLGRSSDVTPQIFMNIIRRCILHNDNVCAFYFSQIDRRAMLGTWWTQNNLSVWILGLRILGRCILQWHWAIKVINCLANRVCHPVQLDVWLSFGQFSCRYVGLKLWGNRDNNGSWIYFGLNFRVKTFLTSIYKFSPKMASHART